MNTLFTGQQLIRLNSVDSTNNYAATLLNATKVVEGTVIVAHQQTQGKGQRGNNWESEAGKNLTFSLIYQPKFLQANQQFMLSKAIALALFDYLSQEIDPVFIKWPNDLYCGNKKIAGILIENSMQAAHIGHSVIGIGLNVNQSQFSDTLIATSLHNESGKPYDLSKVLEDLCEHIEKRYLQLRTLDFQAFDTAYLQHLFRYNVTTTFKVEEGEIEAKIIGISEEGFLNLELADGTKKSYENKAIKLLI